MEITPATLQAVIKEALEKETEVAIVAILRGCASNRIEGLIPLEDREAIFKKIMEACDTSVSPEDREKRYKEIVLLEVEE